MKSEFSKYSKDTVVTVGILEDILDEKLDARFDRQDEKYSRIFGLVIDKLDAIQSDMNEYRQEGQANSRSILKNEQRIENLDGRVLKLETVN